MNNITLLVNSCDKYSDAWMPFFTLFDTYFSNFTNEKFLNTEKLEYNSNNVKTIHSSKKTWSKRLIDALKQVDTEYVLFMLEDFFLQKPVKQDIFYSHLDYISKHKDVGVIYYIPDMDYNLWQAKTYDESLFLEEIIPGSPLRINAQTAIWRKEYLLKILLSKEDPWDFEKFGSLRSIKYKDKVLCCKSSKDVFHYKVYIGFGYGISGKWLKNNKELFEKHNINVNFENLGWFEEKEKVITTRKQRMINYIKHPKTLFSRLRIALKGKFPFLNI